MKLTIVGLLEPENVYVNPEEVAYIAPTAACGAETLIVMRGSSPNPQEQGRPTTFYVAEPPEKVAAMCTRSAPGPALRARRAPHGHLEFDTLCEVCGKPNPEHSSTVGDVRVDTCGDPRCETAAGFMASLRHAVRDVTHPTEETRTHP